MQVLKCRYLNGYLKNPSTVLKSNVLSKYLFQTQYLFKKKSDSLSMIGATAFSF
jgi:hypothetical protein